ncbi:MAG: hypothetical protein A2X84_04100 [Desulfuromonadaceae bacterium GWC2_58_13]|nr:MAG: hypothetical protein A2X84_04100 [Desulfuromonadaceae bacterium GWC2_58_13]
MVAGELELMPLQEIVAGIEARKISGVLRVAQGIIEKKFYFSDGDIIFVTSTQAGERIGEFLSSIGCLDLNRMQSLLEDSQRRSVRFTADLLEEKVFERKSLETAISQLIIIALADALCWQVGSFALTANLPQSVQKGPISIRVAGALEKSIRLNKSPLFSRNQQTSTF